MQSRRSNPLHRILADRDLFDIAWTGTAKTLAFVLLILSRLSTNLVSGDRQKIRVLIVAPSRALVGRIEENLPACAKHLPSRTAAIHVGISERPQIQALRKRLNFDIAMSGGLIDRLQQRHRDFSGLSFLVLNEADRQ